MAPLKGDFKCVINLHWVFNVKTVNLQDNFYLISYVVFHPLSGMLPDNLISKIHMNFAYK